MLHTTALFLIIFTILIVGFIIYLLYANLSKPKKWPFVKKTVIIKEVPTIHGLATVVRDEPVSTGNSVSSIVGVIIIIIILAVSLVFIYIGMKITLKRYEIAGQAIKQGDTGVAVAALAPEIGQGVRAVTDDIFHNYDPNTMHGAIFGRPG